MLGEQEARGHSSPFMAPINRSQGGNSLPTTGNVRHYLPMIIRNYSKSLSTAIVINIYLLIIGEKWQPLRGNIVKVRIAFPAKVFTCYIKQV